MNIEQEQMYEREMGITHKSRLKRRFKNDVMQHHYEFLVIKDGLNWKTAEKQVKKIYGITGKKYECFVCDKKSIEGIGGRFLPMDKRERGDNGFGNTYFCYKCVPKQFGES